MQVTIPKLTALVLAIAWVLAAAILGRSWTLALTVAVGTLLPLALIWFPDVIGSLRTWSTKAPIDKPSPPWLVTTFGWLLLLGLPVYVAVVTWRAQ